jgi:hypothetical protein
MLTNIGVGIRIRFWWRKLKEIIRLCFAGKSPTKMETYTEIFLIQTSSGAIRTKSESSCRTFLIVSGIENLYKVFSPLIFHLFCDEKEGKLSLVRATCIGGHTEQELSITSGLDCFNLPYFNYIRNKDGRLR